MAALAITPLPVPVLAPVLRVVDQASRLGERVTSLGARLVGHVPHVAPEAYLHVIHAPLDAPALEALTDAIGRAVPSTYQRVLRAANGFSLFSESLSLYGHRASYTRRGDAAWQPFSLSMPNREERPAGLSRDAFIIGGYGRDGSLLVLAADDTVFRCERDAATPLNRWPDLSAMLAAEAARLADCFDAEGRLRMAGSDRTAPPPDVAV